MTVVTVSLRTAIRIALARKKAIPRWKRWRLKNPDRDKAQKRAYYWRNRGISGVKGGIRSKGKSGTK